MCAVDGTQEGTVDSDSDAPSADSSDDTPHNIHTGATAGGPGAFLEAGAVGGVAWDAAGRTYASGNATSGGGPGSFGRLSAGARSEGRGGGGGGEGIDTGGKAGQAAPSPWEQVRMHTHTHIHTRTRTDKHAALHANAMHPSCRNACM